MRFLSTIALLGVVFAAHECSILEAASSAFTMRINVIYRKILPRDFASTGCAHSVGGIVPKDPALLRRETTLRILPRK